MKCDELIEKIKQAADDYRHKFIPIHLDIEIEDVLAAFAELKAENERLNNLLNVWHTYKILGNTCKELKAPKRALWLARAERANAEWGHWATIWFCDTNVELNINKSSVSQDPYRCPIKRNAAIWRNLWREVERKCRAKAEEYK